LSEEEIQEVGIGDFRLHREAGIKVGSWRLIEPRIPDQENRIARQRALFLADYNVHDLREVANYAIFFHQRPDEIFEDPAAGFTEAALLEADTSRLARLASQTRRRFKAGRAASARPLSSTLASISLPASRVIGSSDAQLLVVLNEAKSFFEALGQVTRSAPELAAEVGDIFNAYFTNVRLFADAGESPTAGRELTVRALHLALDRLERLAELRPGQLRELVATSTPNDEPSYRGPELPYSIEDDTTGQRTRIAAACALYLTGWEHLVRVRGFRARGLSLRAREVLAAHQMPWLPHPSDHG